MNKDILLVIEAISNEKDVPKDVIFEAIEAALASAIAKKIGGNAKVRVSIDRATGEYQAFRRWEVVEDSDPSEPRDASGHRIPLSEARKRDEHLDVGSVIEEPIQVNLGGRIAAQMVKQVVIQKVREAERAKVVETYRERQGELITGIVKKFDRHSILLDLGGNAEALIPRDHMIPGESVRVGDRLRAYLFAVQPEAKGPQLFASRTMPELLIELFKLEVPEVGEGLIEILGAARDFRGTRSAGESRAKIAVRAKDRRIDPIGACVGMRGSRVQAVTNELHEERVDIIEWDENPAQFIVNAMSPADVVSIIIDEDANSVDVAVTRDNLAQAIGRNGQNIRLASQLTGWTINVMDTEEAAEKQAREAKKLVDHFIEQLGVDEDIAKILVERGFSTLDEIAYLPLAELLAIEEFDEALVHELRDRAKDALLTLAIANEEGLSEKRLPESLKDLEGMDEALERSLHQQGIETLDDLAEYSVDELVDCIGIEPERAGKLIMQAREPWFAQAGTSSGGGHSDE